MLPFYWLPGGSVGAPRITTSHLSPPGCSIGAPLSRRRVVALVLPARRLPAYLREAANWDLGNTCTKTLLGTSIFTGQGFGAPRFRMSFCSSATTCPRRPHNDMLDSGVTRSRSPHAYREDMALNPGRMRQQRARRQRSPSPLRRASSKRRGGTRGRPQPPSRHPLRTASPRPANVGERTHTPTARSRRPPRPSPQTAAPHPAPSLTVTFPAGFHIGGLASPPSPAAVESMLCAFGIKIHDLSVLAAAAPTCPRQCQAPCHCVPTGTS